MLLAKEARGVFGEEASLLYSAQDLKIIIGNFLILLVFLLPGDNEVVSRLEFTLKTAGSGRVLAADFELASAFHQAVGHPALECRVIIAEGAGREVKDIPIRDTVAGINLAAAGDKGEKQ